MSGSRKQAAGGARPRHPPAWQAKRLLEWTKGVLAQVRRCSRGRRSRPCECHRRASPASACVPQLVVKENDLVCDLWCGPGSNTARFAAAKSQFYLGISRKMLRQARSLACARCQCTNGALGPLRGPCPAPPCRVGSVRPVPQNSKATVGGGGHR
jgi:hypothetical protein